MYYYQIAISAKFKLINGNLPTYHSANRLNCGQLVTTSYGRKKVIGVVVNSTAKPKFKTKELKMVNFKLAENNLILAKKIADYYACSLHQTIGLFLPPAIHKKFKIKDAKIKKIKTSKPGILTESQFNVFNEILQSAQKTFLLQGETGSGKSYIYLHLARKLSLKGGSSIILTPEISLSPQLVELFEKHLEVPVIALNSQMGQMERRESLLKVAELDTCVVIGPRSALFSPINNLRLIVIDEFHETSYKNDNHPKYNTQVVASMLASICQAKLILGSATPRVQDYWIAKKKNIPILQIARRSESKVNIKFIDQNNKLLFFKSKILSQNAITAITDNLTNNLQTIIFHNQRGTARSLLCSKCDWVYSCDSCASRLVFHKQPEDEYFFCHLCTRRYPSPTSCEFKHLDIHLVGFGTKKIADEVSRIFPGVEITRMDTDQKELILNISKIKNNKVKIIIGTQMLAKGHNFKYLKTVIIPQADTGLGHPDFTAQEKTYQLLHQVIGRVGRFNTDGEIILQSYNPKNKILSLATSGSFNNFYDYEIKERMLSLMPPFCFALKISVAYKKESYAINKLNEFIETLNKNEVRCLGPSPAFQKKVSGKFKYQIIILSKNRSNLTKILNSIPTSFNFDIDPINFL